MISFEGHKILLMRFQITRTFCLLEFPLSTYLAEINIYVY